MKQPKKYWLQRAKHEPPLLPWTAAALITCLALVTQARLSDFCWGVWLVDVLLFTVTVITATVKTFLLIFEPDALWVPEGEEKEAKPWEVKQIDLKKQIRASFLVMLYVGIATLFYYGLFALLGTVLQSIFPFPNVPYREATPLEYYRLIIDLVSVSLPMLWPAVLLAVALKPPHLLKTSIEKFDQIFEGKLLKIHYSFILGVPITLLIRDYIPEWETVVLVILIFVFYSPDKRPHGLREQ